MKKRIIGFAALVISTALSLFASPLDEAAVAYNNGDFNKAIEIYENVARERGVSASLLLNLGNASVKAGDYGKAMLCYERAYRIDPGNKEVKNNIAYLQSKIEDNNKAETKGKKVSVAPEDKPFFTSLKRYVAFSHTSNTWALWAGILFVVAIGAVAIYIFTSNVLLRKVGFFGGFITFAISVITLIFALISASERKKASEGVITSYKINLYSEPSQSSKAGMNALTRGTLLDIMEEETPEDTNIKWYKVRLNSDYSGWISSADFEVI